MHVQPVPSDGGPGRFERVEIALAEDGQCQLVLETAAGESQRFPCSLPTLMDVALGKQAHLASDSGTCLLSKGAADRIIVSLGGWGDPHAMLFIQSEAFADTLMQLLLAKAKQELFVS